MINKNKLIPLIAFAITVILTLSPINSITSHALIAETTVDGWIDTSVSGIRGSDLDASDDGVIDVSINLKDMDGDIINNPAYVVDVSSDNGTLVALTPVNKDGIVVAQIQLNPGVTSAKVNSTVTYENVNCENTKAYKEPVFTEAQLADQEEFEFLLFDDNFDFSDWVTYDPIEEEALPDDTTSGDAESAALLDAWLLDTTPTDKEEQTLLESFDLTFGEDFTFDLGADPTDEEVALEYTDPKACIQSYASQNLKSVELVAVNNPVTTTPTLPLPVIKPVATPAPVPVAAVTPIKPVTAVTDSTTPRTGGVYNYVIYGVTMLMIIGMYITFGKSKKRSKLYFSNIGKIGKTGLIGKINKFSKTNRNVSFDKVKTTKVIKSIFMLFIALILSSASLMMLNLDLESNAAATQNLYIFKENVGGNDLYSQTIDGKEVANFSMYDNRDGSFCSISTLRKPDKSEIRYYVEKNNLGKNMINYFTKTGINKGATKINWQGDRVFIEGNKDGYVSKLSSGKFNSAATTYVQKPLTDVKAIDKKILDVCNTKDGINKVNKLFKDEKSVYFKETVIVKPPIVKVVDTKPNPPVVVDLPQNLTFLNNTDSGKPDDYKFSVLDKSTGQFCTAYYQSLNDRSQTAYQLIKIQKGKILQDILNNISKTELVFNNFKNKETNYFKVNTNNDADYISVKYRNKSGTTVDPTSSDLARGVENADLNGFVITQADVPGIVKSMFSDCLKSNGVQNAVDTYLTRFKKDSLIYSDFSTNLTFLNNTDSGKPDDYKFSVLDKSTGQFCTAYYQSLNDRSQTAYQLIKIQKGKILQDILNNISKTELVFNNFKNKETNYFKVNTNIDADYISVKYRNKSGTTVDPNSSSLDIGNQYSDLNGFVIPQSEVPVIVNDMFSDCMKLNGVQNAVDTYLTRFKKDILIYSNFSSNLTYLNNTDSGKPDHYKFSVLDKTSGQFCTANYERLSDRSQTAYQLIKIQKGKVLQDILNNISKTELVFNNFKNKDTDYFKINTYIDTDTVSVKYSSRSGTTADTTSSSLEKSNQYSDLNGFVIPQSDVPRVITNMFSDCIKLNGVQNAVDTYLTRFKNDTVNNIK